MLPGTTKQPSPPKRGGLAVDFRHDHAMSAPVPPSISGRSFSCPTCDAHTSQTWFSLFSNKLDDTTPGTASYWQKFISEHYEHIPDAHLKSLHVKVATLLLGLPFLEESSERYLRKQASNLHLSQCFSCSEFAVWIGEKMIFPPRRLSIPPNADLPDDIKADFNEARAIIDESPRGAAALLRLAVQKLCKYLGQPGKDINSDIGALVRNGLNPIVQQALDSVRVIGNESVHPGELDLRDNPEIAHTLFSLVNTIADQLITHPKAVNAIYANLPNSKREGIDQRDGTKNSRSIS